MDRLERGARTTQDRIGRMVRSNPLLVGAGALMLGVAFGIAVPETDVENEWLGEARDSVMNRAQQMAHDAAAKSSTLPVRRRMPRAELPRAATRNKLEHSLRARHAARAFFVPSLEVFPTADYLCDVV